MGEIAEDGGEHKIAGGWGEDSGGWRIGDEIAEDG